MWRSMLCVVVVVVASVGALAVEQGLVAHWPMNEGQGKTIRDVSGNGNHGTLHGCEWVKVGTLNVLRLNGDAKDYVDCGSGPSLDLTGPLTLEAWVFAEKKPTIGEPGILGKAYSSYVLTYFKTGRIFFYGGSGSENVATSLATGAWHHIVGAFDGKMRRIYIYIDGQLRAMGKSKSSTLSSGKTFYIGKSDGAVRWTHGVHFTGMIHDARVYNRALSAAEVRRQYMTGHDTGVLDIHANVHYFAGEIQVEVGLLGLRTRKAARRDVQLWLTRKGDKTAICKGGVRDVGMVNCTSATLKIGDLNPGSYEVHGRLVDDKQRPIGESAAAPVTWPNAPAWPIRRPEHKVLNNWVTELLSVTPGKDAKQFTFVNPRKGWVFIATTGTCRGRGEVALTVDKEPKAAIRHRKAGRDVLEAMRFLAEGEHTVSVRATNGSRVEKLVVRAIPEIVYGPVPRQPHMKAYGVYDREFLKDVLPNANVAFALGDDLDWWLAQGKRAYYDTGFSRPRPPEKPPTVEEYVEHWAGNERFTAGKYTIVNLDEFFVGDYPYYPNVTEAIRRLATNKKYAHMTLRPYITGQMYAAKGSRKFMQVAMDSGCTFAWERYPAEVPTEREACRLFDSHIVRSFAGYQEAFPGIERRTIINLGYLSAPNESGNINPNVDYKVFMDLQYYMIVNAPNLFGIYGVQEYTPSYADEEYVRWAGKLWRHYCIEGKATMLSREYGFVYRAEHLKNQDFADGLKEWTVKAAETGSITTGLFSGYSYLQGRYPMTTRGDTFLLAKRSAKRPNVFSQVVRGLDPGKVYALRIFSSDYGELLAGKSKQVKNAVTIRLDNVEPIRRMTFDQPFPNCYSHKIAAFDRKNQYWMNYHQRIFRAKGTEAKLTVSDWASGKKPGGPIGRQLMFNFFEVQLYLQP